MAKLDIYGSKKIWAYWVANIKRYVPFSFDVYGKKIYDVDLSNFNPNTIPTELLEPHNQQKLSLEGGSSINPLTLSNQSPQESID